MCLIARIALLVAPSEGEAEDARLADIVDFVSKHQTMLETVIAGQLTAAEAGEAAKLSEGLLRLLQLRHKRQSRERFGTFLTTSIDEGGGKVHKWLKGNQQPDVFYSSLFAGLTTDPSQIFKGKDVGMREDLEMRLRCRTCHGVYRHS